MQCIRKLFSLLVTFILIFHVLPIDSLADTLKKEENPTSIIPSDPPKLNESAILEESVLKREKNTKHFLKEDKSYEAVVYPSAVHFKENGLWTDIDNSLIDSTNELKETVLENKKNNYKIQMSKNSNASKLVKVKQEDYEISWNIDSPQKTEAQVRSQDLTGYNTLSENEKKKTLLNLTSVVDYKEVYPNIDLSYEILAESVKENIIIKDKMTIPYFTFNLQLKNLVPELQMDQSILFYDKQEPTKVVYKMDAPFMYDAKGETSTDITIGLTVDGDKAILTVTPSFEWVNADDRAYPITLDPTLNTSLNATYDSHVSEQYPTTNYQLSIMNKVGYGSSSARNRSYLSFALPALTTADTVIGANLYLSLYSSNTTNAQVNLHKVTGAWSSGTINWNNQPTFDPSVIDYQKINGNAGASYSWDVTKTVKDWYQTGVNNGLMLKTKDEYSGYTEFFSSDTSTTYGPVRPLLVLGYVNNSGLENYWTYHSQNLGRSGTGYVNDFNGNLIYVHNDMSMSGNRMPVSINHVFNSNERGMNLGYGLGWRLNLSQKVESKDIGGTAYYLYTDEDGTIHYLAHDAATNSYKDESGLDLTLTINTASSAERYVLKDKKDNQLSFTSTGYLYKIKDPNGNAITLSYSGSTLVGVTDGATRKTILTYGTDGKLSTIQEPGGRVTTFLYSGNHLITIRYADSKETNFQYDRITKLLNVTGIDGYQIQYGYNTTEPYQIKSIKEAHTDGSIGQSLTINYGDNVTNFTDYKGRKTQYQFNDVGHSIAIQNHKGYAQYYKYFEDNESSNGNKNKLIEESKLQQTVMNFIRNHNLESTRFWVASNDSTSTGSSSYTTESKYTGNQSIKIKKTNNVGSHRYSQEVTLEKGKTYTFSGYLKTTDVSSSTQKGATLIVAYQDANGVWQEVSSGYINGTNNWERKELTFTIPSNALSNVISAKLSLVGETGTAYFDAIQLEEGKVANRYNLLENPDFRYLENNLPVYWSKNSYTDASDLVVSDSSNPTSLDDRVFTMKGDSNLNKNISQTIDVSGSTGDIITFNGWAKGNSTPLNYPRYFALDLVIYYSDGTKKYVPVNFNADSAEWQYLSAMAEAEKSYYQVSLYLIYYQNENNVSFDGLQLYQETFSTSYSYDANGNLVNTKDLAKEQSKFEYNAKNDLIAMVDPKGNRFTYDYDDKHNLNKAMTAENVVYTFDQDSYGNPLWGMVGDSTSLFMKSTATYTTSGNYTHKVTDPSGNTVEYKFDEAEDELDSVTDPKGNVTSYQYNDLSQLNSVSKTIKNTDGTSSTVSNSYTYENDRLKTVNHPGGTFTFHYDSFGNSKEILVGTQKIFTNIYDSNNGDLLETQYSNNQTIGYGYDELDRLTSLKYNGVEKFRYGFNERGNIGLLEDLENGVNYRYEYDLADRLSQVKDNQGNSVNYTYDKNNNVNKVKEKIDQKEFETSYDVDKDNRPKLVTYNRNGQTSNWSYQYDTLGRLFERSLVVGTTNYKTSLKYKNGLNGSTTNQIESINNNGETISYTYDANGNIDTIASANGTVNYYYYNELNELIREDNQILNKTVVYEYDLGGNLLSQKSYAYSTGTITSLGTPLDTKSYAYEDSNWKDKLTSFNGKSITYDSIGNPLSYNGFNYVWAKVDQLSNINGNGKTISYKYNADGIRTQKTVNGVTTKYHLDGDIVTFESNGTDEIYYTHDANDHLLSMNLNGQEYYYIRNAQGDIVGLLDQSGSQVVSYQYDTWGNFTISGSLASTVGEKNPYRYRGYRYDSETGLYYLQARYYSPEWGRFINADGYGGTLGDLLSHNTFVYSLNNPINFIDPSGFYAIEGAINAYGKDPALPKKNSKKAKETARSLTKEAASQVTGKKIDAINTSPSYGNAKFGKDVNTGSDIITGYKNVGEKPIGKIVTKTALKGTLNYVAPVAVDYSLYKMGLEEKFVLQESILDALISSTILIGIALIPWGGPGLAVVAGFGYAAYTGLGGDSLGEIVYRKVKSK